MSPRSTRCLVVELVDVDNPQPHTPLSCREETQAYNAACPPALTKQPTPFRQSPGERKSGSLCMDAMTWRGCLFKNDANLMKKSLPICLTITNSCGNIFFLNPFAYHPRGSPREHNTLNTGERSPLTLTPFFHSLVMSTTYARQNTSGGTEAHQNVGGDEIRRMWVYRGRGAAEGCRG